jgi:excisionase family DNA binding protein
MLETDNKALAYGVAEAARLLSISQRKLTYLIGMKAIRTFKVGKSRRITGVALQEFIKAQEKAAR